MQATYIRICSSGTGFPQVQRPDWDSMPLSMCVWHLDLKEWPTVTLGMLHIWLIPTPPEPTNRVAVVRLEKVGFKGLSGTVARLYPANPTWQAQAGVPADKRSRYQLCSTSDKLRVFRTGVRTKCLVHLLASDCRGNV